MTDHKFTDEEVRVALRCHADERNRCDICPYRERGGCSLGMSRDALALINRQKAEIEKLTTERDEARRDCAVAEHNHQLAVAEREANVRGFAETLQKIAAEQASRVVEAMDEIKVVAIKEFAQRLREIARMPLGTLYGTMVYLKDIDTLEKEMTEELK